MSFFKVVITLLLVMVIGVSVEGGVAPNNRKPSDLTNKPKITVDDGPEDMENMDEDTFMTEQWTHPDDMIHEKYNNHYDMENLEDNLMKEQLPSPEMNHRINDNHEVALLDMDNIFQRKMLRRFKRNAFQRKPGYLNGNCFANFGCYSERCDSEKTKKCLCSYYNYGCKVATDCCSSLNGCIKGKCTPLKPPGSLNEKCDEPVHCHSRRCQAGKCLCSAHDNGCQTKEDCCGVYSACNNGICKAGFYGDDCKTNWDCANQNCRIVLYEDCECTKSGDTHDKCEQTYHCCDEMECVNGLCLRHLAGGKCLQPYNCYSGRCINRKCDCFYAGHKYRCLYHFECCNGRCLWSKSKCDLSRFKEACIADDNCYSNNCANNLCSDECLKTVEQACNVTKDCCHGQGYKCQEKKCCKLYRQTCAQHDHCCSKHCIFGTCDLLILAETCETGSECHTGLCIAQKCECVPFDLICSSDIQCCADLYCVDGLCAECRKDDGQCGQHNECCGRYCSSSICKCKPVGQWCEAASQCCPDLICLGGKCSQCLEENAPCPGREGCCQGQCHDGYCKEPKALFGNCEITSQCRFDDVKNECRNGKCLISVGEKCSAHNQCASDWCGSSICKCISDSDLKCSSNEECCDESICQEQKCCGLFGGSCSETLVCCLNLNCIGGSCVKIHFDEKCDKNEECYSESCVDGKCMCSHITLGCTSKKDCCAGLTCYNENCGYFRKGEQSCYSDEQCESAHCLYQICESHNKKLSSRCTFPADCGDGQGCQEYRCCGLPGEVCTEILQCCKKNLCTRDKCLKKSFDQGCDKNEDCESESCVDGLCTCSNLNQYCWIDAECCTPLICFSNYCANEPKKGKICERDIQCTTKLCQEKICKCKDFNSLCVIDEECCDPIHCLNGECCVPEGAGCWNHRCCKGQACRDGKCVPCTNTCDRDHNDCCPYYKEGIGWHQVGGCYKDKCIGCSTVYYDCYRSTDCCGWEFPTNTYPRLACNDGGKCTHCKQYNAPCLSSLYCCSGYCRDGLCTSSYKDLIEQTLKT